MAAYRLIDTDAWPRAAHYRRFTEEAPCAVTMTDEIDVTAYPYAKLPRTVRPCERFFGGNPDLGLAVLRAAGWRRLEIKARRLQARFLRTGDPEQVFYEELFAAFGYAKNSASFRALASRAFSGSFEGTLAMKTDSGSPSSV